MAVPRGAWVDVPIGEFEREAEAILSEAERRAREGPEGMEITFRRLPPGFRLLPGWLEGALPLPSGPIYGSEAIAVVGGREVPLGELLIVRMYDGASGQGVLLRDEEIEPQVEGVRRAARALLAGALGLR
ncbi:MAG: hypothetical protein RXR47_03000 [Nitrososphaeria archaeon]